MTLAAPGNGPEISAGELNAWRSWELPDSPPGSEISEEDLVSVDWDLLEVNGGACDFDFGSKAKHGPAAYNDLAKALSGSSNSRDKDQQKLYKTTRRAVIVSL